MEGKKKRGAVAAAAAAVCLGLLTRFGPGAAAGSRRLTETAAEWTDTYEEAIEEGSAGRDAPGAKTEADGELEVISSEAAETVLSRETEEAARETASVCVYVCGAVQKPGVYTLPALSRVWDALEMAGGFSEGAEQGAVNLAERIDDGMMVRIPFRTENVRLEYGLSGGTESGGIGTETGPVNLNTADAELLKTLPGIGDSKAADIIRFREENGPFRDSSELMKIPGIKEKAYERLKDLVTV